MKRTLARLVALAVVSASASSFAAGILDQQLGGSDATPAPAADNSNKPLADIPVAPALVNPDAAKVVNDMDLLKKLTSGRDASQGDTGAGQQIQDMVDRMGESQQRLDQKDPGNVTQETQRRIVVDLDALIEIARQQCNKVPDPNQKQQPQPSQARTGSKNGHGQGGSVAATDEGLRGGGADTPESNGSDMHQRTPAEWGNLPDRDRDLLAHGSNSQYLPAYRTLIDRYYQALAEIGRSSRDH